MKTKTETTTLTARIPTRLKSNVEQLARARAISLTDLVRQALQDTLTPSARAASPPGSSKVFQDFLEAVGESKQVVFLVVDGRSGHRYFFHGTVDRRLTNDSLVAVRRRLDTSWVIPRGDILAWFTGSPADLKRLSLSLSRQGWAMRTGET